MKGVDYVLENPNDNSTVKMKSIHAFFVQIGTEGLGRGNVKRIMESGFDSVQDILKMSYEDFMKVDLRVAEVIEASHLEGADKLLSIKLSLGDLGEKNVFAGIKSAYDPDQLVGKLVVMVYNLAPRKMKFGNSEGMILAASDSEGGIFVISPDQGAKPGQKIK